jgi:hypothetical protein
MVIVGLRFRLVPVTVYHRCCEAGAIPCCDPTGAGAELRGDAISWTGEFRQRESKVAIHEGAPLSADRNTDLTWESNEWTLDWFRPWLPDVLWRRGFKPRGTFRRLHCFLNDRGRHAPVDSGTLRTWASLVFLATGRPGKSEPSRLSVARRLHQQTKGN